MASYKTLTDNDVVLLNTLASLRATEKKLAVDTSVVSEFDDRTTNALIKALHRLRDKGFVAATSKGVGSNVRYKWFLSASARKFVTGTRFRIPADKVAA